MALKATISKAELQVSDMDRHYYQGHSLTLAQHPSETEERMMIRLLAFGLNASEQLAFGRGISTDDEPDLWARYLAGQIDLWIEVGQPDQHRIRKACGQAGGCASYVFSGRSAAIWWQKNAEALQKCSNLRVFEIPSESSQELAGMAARNMKLQCLVQDGQVQVMQEDGAGVTIDVVALK